MNEPSDAVPGAATGTMSQETLGLRCRAIREQIARAFVGQDEVVDRVLIALLAGGHVLIEGVPGLGKTLLVRALAAALKCNYARIQFTPDLMPADVSGHAFYDPEGKSFRIRRGPVFTNLLLADEINRAPAKTQAALLEAMQERQVTIESRSLAIAPPFLVVATQNPIEHDGTYPLPEAQLDRFLLKVRIGYPPQDEELRMVERISSGRSASDFDLSQVRPVAAPADIVAMQRATAAIRVDPVVLDYAVRIARATRDWPGLMSGAGPRGGLALVWAARAHAALQGRDFTTPEDVRSVVKPALRHRVMLAPEMQIEGREVDQVLDTVLAKVEAPRK